MSKLYYFIPNIKIILMSYTFSFMNLNHRLSDVSAIMWIVQLCLGNNSVVRKKYCKYKGFWQSFEEMAHAYFDYDENKYLKHYYFDVKIHLTCKNICHFTLFIYKWHNMYRCDLRSRTQQFNLWIEGWKFHHFEEQMFCYMKCWVLASAILI